MKIYDLTDWLLWDVDLFIFLVGNFFFDFIGAEGSSTSCTKQRGWPNGRVPVLAISAKQHHHKTNDWNKIRTELKLNIKWTKNNNDNNK